MDLNITITVTDGVEPAEIVRMLNAVAFRTDSFSADGSLVIGWIDGDPGHAVPGEPFVPSSPSTPVRVTSIRLADAADGEETTIA